MGFRKRGDKLFASALATAFLAAGCVGQGEDSGGRQSNSRDGARLNTPSTLSVGHGRVLSRNPIVLSGNSNLGFGADLSVFLGGQVFITNNNSLLESCTENDPVTAVDINIPSCFSNLEKLGEAPIAPISGRWGFNIGTQEWLQTHTFYHTKIAVERFHESLRTAYTNANPFPAASPYETAIPTGLYTQGAFWYDSRNLITYSSCGDFANARFDPADFILCYGVDSATGARFADDPSVIYHEVGHAMVKIWLNMRNIASTAPVIASTVRSDFGSAFYDEALSINEGIADYISHVITNRTRFGEWALRQFARPIGEEDGLHPVGINETSEGRFSYPDFIDFDVTFPTTPIEDTHLTGQIASHFFKEVQDQLVERCELSVYDSKTSVMYLIGETLAELGDLTSRASDSNTVNTNHVNLTTENPDGLDDFLSFRWAHFVNPPTLRSFFQKFGKYFLKVFNNGVSCNGGNFGQDNFEQLLDDYGLLMFNTYNEDGNGFNDPVETGHAGGNTAVNQANRNKSLMIPKDLIIYDPRDGASEAFVFDDQQSLLQVITNLKFAGSKIQISPQISTNLAFNNGNNRISPGEVIGLSLNLYNNSNTTMGGIQVLANDWDQGKINTTTGELEPCNNFEDEFPLDSEGAADRATEVIPANDGDCNSVTKVNGSDTTSGTPNEPLAPICWVQQLGENETRWVSQNTYRKDIGLDSSKCLDPNSNNFNDCVMRVVSGASHAFYSKMDPQKTWAESLTVLTAPTPDFPDGNVLTSAQFTTGNLVLFEVSPFITPGTIFNCRFRVRFTNCADCWEDPDRADNDDYLDYEYSGDRPYKIFNLQFSVVD